MIPRNTWSEKKPSTLCSDAPRIGTAVWQHDEIAGLENIPAFDRLRLTCARGKLPPRPKTGNKCLVNSEMVNRKCQCKTNYTDAAEKEELKDLMETHGYPKVLIRFINLICDRVTSVCHRQPPVR